MEDWRALQVLELDFDCHAISNTGDIQQRSQSRTSCLEYQEDAAFNYLVSSLIAADLILKRQLDTNVYVRNPAILRVLNQMAHN